MRNFKNITLVMIVFIPVIIFGAGNRQEVREIVNKVEHNKTDRGHWFLALPFENPETGGGIGGTTLYYAKSKNKTLKNKMNVTQIYGAMALNSKRSLGFTTERYYKNSNNKFFAMGEMKSWPDYFWGIGPDTKEQMKEEFTANTLYLNIGSLKKLWNNIYLGPLFRFGHSTMKKTDPNGLLGQNIIPGSDKSLNIGSGLQLSWDERDNIFYPHKGIWLQVTGLLYSKTLGSDYNFSTLELDQRNYVQIYGDHVLALQGLAQFCTGTVPFHSMYKMGGSSMMRGVRYGRYVDKNYIAGQVEYRSPAVWRFGYVLFGSMAQVAPSTRSFTRDNFVYTWGAGLRFTLDKTEHINCRLDAGFDEDSNGSIYLTVKEAF